MFLLNNLTKVEPFGILARMQMMYLLTSTGIKVEQYRRIKYGFQYSR